MKTIAILTLLPSFSFAGSSILSFSKIPTSTVHMNTRKLELSESCELAFEALDENEAFKAANQTKFLEAENVDTERYCDSSGSKLTCKIDSAGFSSQPAYESACKEANGKLVPVGFGLSCSVNGGTMEIVQNDMNCVPSTCMEAEFGETLDELEDEYKTAFEYALRAAGLPGATCTVNLEDDKVTSAANEYSMLAVTALGAMAMSMAFVI